MLLFVLCSTAFNHASWGEVTEDICVQPRHPPMLREYPLHSVAFDPNGEFVVTGCSDGTVRLLSVLENTENNAELDHGGVVYCVAFDPVSGRYLATGGDSKKVRVFDLRTTKLRNPRRLHAIEGGA